MASKGIRRFLFSPDGREKVGLFGSHDGAYGFRVWQRRRKAWRRAGEIQNLESYARAVFEAANQIPWLARVLTPESGDYRFSYHLELLRGYAFRFAVYDGQGYGENDHCSACRKTFSEVESLSVQHEGYVTRYAVPNGLGTTQWKWLCKQCFEDLRKAMQWSVDNTNP